MVFIVKLPNMDWCYWLLQDLNVRLVEDISKTRGAKYLSVDNPDEFKTIMNQV